MLYFTPTENVFTSISILAVPVLMSLKGGVETQSLPNQSLVSSITAYLTTCTYKLAVVHSLV